MWMWICCGGRALADDFGELFLVDVGLCLPIGGGSRITL